MDKVTVPIIRTREDLRGALDRLAIIFYADEATPESDERDALAAVIEAYERVHFPISAPDPATAIRFAMEQRGLTTGELARLLGGRSRVSDVMTGRRSLSLGQIRKLNAELGIPLDCLMSETKAAPPRGAQPLSVRETRSSRLGK